MKATLLATTLKSLFKVGRTVVIEGPPGVGKTTIARQVANELEVDYVEVHLPTALVEDFGIPYPNAVTEQFKYFMPDWYPYQGKPGTENGGILCFDDRNQASADLQKVLANICQARNLHGVPLAAGYMVVSTGNRQSDRAGANRILSHLRNRETILELDVITDDWTSWALQHGVNAEVVSFIQFRPNLLIKFDPAQESNPTPRSWVEGVSDVIGMVPAEAEHECFSGAVGKGAASEFVGYLRVWRNLPDINQILANPEKAVIPSDPAVLYATAGAVADKAKKDNMDKIIAYCSRLPKEFSVLTVNMAVRRDVELCNTPAFGRWSLQHGEVLF